MSTQSWIRSVCDLLDDMGVEYAFEIHRRHIRVLLRGNGQMGSVTISVSPSDQRALLNVRRDVRHALGLVCNKQTA